MEVTGAANITAAMQKLIAMKPILTGIAHTVTINGSFASWRDKWTLSGTAPDGSAVTLSSGTVGVMQRDDQGVWRWHIDNPTGKDHWLPQA